jgi:hypothetical protein
VIRLEDPGDEVIVAELSRSRIVIEETIEPNAIDSPETTDHTSGGWVERLRPWDLVSSAPAW